ncbi:hypothetical protein [Sphingomonas sp. CROZ-RG-20F-R02-07]|uniref:hypothetical protein n=1 Tax=Sphingomonas sp. CROZ-RG-20F-R02-07 TaxID=2914832 RepID=UPI001F5A5EF8|nr:hypothetical protein [Sphingomonas sp. CROZ-RG-20F-R02-07]
MTAAYRLKGFGWFASGVGVVLAFYLVSLQVATERKKLEAVNGHILAAQRDIRALETEFDTRANLAQLERWNGDTLALAAPTAGQFVADADQLAALDVNALPSDDAKVQTAALVVPSAPGAMPAPITSAPAIAAPVSAPSSAPAVQVAAVQMAKVAASPRVIRAAAIHIVEAAHAPTVHAAHAKPQAMAMLDRKLLSDTTLGDILSGARAEAGHRR